MAFGGDGCHPEWSPDGRKILFCQDTRGATIGWIGIDERGAGKYPFPVPHVVDIGLNRDNHILACPDWSPDGKYVVFSLGPVHFEVKRRVVRFGHKTPWDQKGQRIFQEICVSRFDPSDGKKVWIQLTEGGFANRDPDWGR
jgi:Tol biopolymer transport system component